MSEEKNNKEFILPKRKYTAEFLVGIFALVGLGSFGYLSINLAGMKIFSSGYYEVKAEFADVSGLKLGAPVEIAGVKVGEVADIILNGTNGTNALVNMQLFDGIKLRDDDIAMIRTKGIIGDRFVKISPGSSEELVAPGGQLNDTESALEFEDVVGKLIHKME